MQTAGRFAFSQFGSTRHLSCLTSFKILGMVRSFVVRPTDSGSQSSLRPKRFKILLRGTLRYCSLVVHQRQEQGRVDDLWSLMYMLIELHAGLPWRELRDERKLEELKVKTDFKTLLVNCPPEFLRCLEHLDTLRYEHRPDYKLLYDAVGCRRPAFNGGAKLLVSSLWTDCVV